MNSEELLSKIKEIIILDYPSAKILFYGSRSRGDNTIHSDWDILIVIDKNLNERQKIEIHNKIFELELQTDEIINSIVHTKLEWNNPLMQLTPFYHNVINEGIVL